jgi:exopolysaccharide biosynthesis polyprenyl glycosylphosphotransferase
MVAPERFADRPSGYRRAFLPRTRLSDPQSAPTPDSPAQWSRRYAATVLALDVLAAAAAVAVTWTLHPDPDATGPGVAAATTLALLAWVGAIAIAGGYEGRFLGIGSEEYRRVALGAFGLIAVIATVEWETDLPVARRYILVALPLALASALVARYGWRKRVHRLRRRGRFQQRTIVLGPRAAVRELVVHLAASDHHGYHVVGVCLTDDPGGIDRVDGVPIAGCVGDLVASVQELRADTVAITSGTAMAALDVRRLCWDLAPTEANLVIAPALMDVTGPRTAVRPVEGLPLLHVEQPRLTGLKRVVKAVYDPVVATLGLLLLIPVFVAIAVAIKVDTRGPAFFRQRRVGRGGKEFTILKFRTMVADADQRKAELQLRNEGSGPLFKLHRDPRITRVGRLLRRTSLDELPQLVNVATGDMSLVGPRPHLPEEVALFGADLRPRLLVKPGLTGLWQVSGRSDLSLEESTRVDLRYVENWSLALDVTILWKTLSAVVRGSGAY